MLWSGSRILADVERVCLLQIVTSGLVFHGARSYFTFLSSHVIPYTALGTECAFTSPLPRRTQYLPFLFSRLDIYRKVPKDLTQPTYTGAFSKCLTSDAGFHRPVSFYVNVLPCVISLLVSLALSLGWLIVPALNVIGVAAWLTMAWNAAQWASDFFGLEWLSS